MKQKTNVHSDEEDQSPVQFSVNLQNNQRKRRSQVRTLVNKTLR